MTSDRQPSSPEAERHFLESLRAQYEEKGYAFTVEPTSSQVPDFLGSYVPDAIARKPGHNVVIEVKRRQSSSTERALKEIQRLFEGQSDWHFRVVFIGGGPLESLTIPTSTKAALQRDANEIQALATKGYLRPAFVMAWALLEAAVRALDVEVTGRPHTPGTIVQTLATNGLIEPEVEGRMRSLIVRRNRIVHGDLALEPAAEDVGLVLSVIKDILNVGTE